MNLLIYGGYHHEYIYTNHLKEGISKLNNIKTFSAFYKIENNLFLKKKNHYLPPIKKIKYYLEEIVVRNKITHIINYNTNHFNSQLIEFLKKSFNLKIGVYFNDSPFSYNLSKRFYYKTQKKSITKYNYIFVYRNGDKKKILEKYNFNNSFIRLVPPSCPEEEYLKYIKFSNNFLYDFAFIGHYEPDGRLNVIRDLISKGHRCLVIGLKWPEKEISLFNSGSKIINKRLEYLEYLSLLSSAYVNLGFISKINNDSYTRRYFECPFSNSLFLAYESETYKNLNTNMPNIIFCKSKIPSIQDCLQALELAKLGLHYPDEEQKKIFYQNNCIYQRANIFSDFLNS